MTVFPLLAVRFIMTFVAVVFVVCAVLLILLILIQKGKGGGLSGAFGGVGAAGGIFGSKTGDRLTWFTIILVGVFLTLAVVMAKFYKPTVSSFGEEPAVQQAQPSTADTSTDTNPLEE
ncbi:MAG: preprotein translocase subunit SecG [Planctomycetota bacterium]|jgi:preprotein translocase subunit SecG